MILATTTRTRSTNQPTAKSYKDGSVLIKCIDTKKLVYLQNQKVVIDAINVFEGSTIPEWNGRQPVLKLAYKDFSEKELQELQDGINKIMQAYATEKEKAAEKQPKA